jgi:iron complex outermembrane receptor protein
MLNLSVTRTFSLGTSTLDVSLFGRNLLDDVARRHTSFVKDEVPLPGRNLGLKLAYKL